MMRGGRFVSHYALYEKSLNVENKVNYSSPSNPVS